MRRLNGEKLRELRESRQLDQAAFAKRAQLVGRRHGYPTGLTQPTVSRYELGGQRPTHRNLVAMALALGVAPDDLLVDEAQREQQEASSDDDEEEDAMAEFLEALRPVARLFAHKLHERSTV